MSPPHKMENKKMSRSPPHTLGPSPSRSLGPSPTRSYRTETCIGSVTHCRSNPRQLRVERKDNGFGFTLRHFIVYPPEEGNETGPPIQDPMDTIFVKSVKELGPAGSAGLNIGDRIVSVNGEPVSGRSYAQVVQMIQNSRDSLYLVVVPRQDDILQVYFSDIAQNPESNQNVAAPPGPGKPPWPTSVATSSSSRESSPFSSKTSDSTRDSVYGNNPRTYSARVQMAAAAVTPPVPVSLTGWRARLHFQPPSIVAPPPVIETVNTVKRVKEEGDSLAVPCHEPSQFTHSTSDQVILGSPTSSNSGGGAEVTKRRESDSSILAGFTSQLERIRRDCELKDEFLKKTTYPAYLSSPPKEVDQSPYGIASLASTMPPARNVIQSPRDTEIKPQKNLFMDIYSHEVDKMQSVKKIAAPTKKRTFDATHFNAYGLPLGYRKGNSYENVDNFSRNNYIIVGSRTLHCEPPQVYQPMPEPPLGPGLQYHRPAVPSHPAGPPAYCSCVYCSPCPSCMPPSPCCSSMMTVMKTAPPSRPSRPSTLSLQNHHGPLQYHHGALQEPRQFRQGSLQSPSLPPSMISTPVCMQKPTFESVSGHHSLYPVYSDLVETGRRYPDLYRRDEYHSEDEERNLRRISYLQATKVERMEIEENLTNETGLAPTHSIKKLKSIFSEKSREKSPSQEEPHPMPPPPTSARLQEPSSPVKVVEQSVSPPSETIDRNIREGYLTCKQVAVVDGKKANDRSWKTVYAVLKQKALYMFKDKKMALDNMEYEEKPVKLVESEVEVASDYTKRKNVFRVKTDAGSEYLFQAENEGLMKEWVGAIDDACMAIIVDERKESNKLRKLTSFRNRSPTGQSPASKSRKSSAELQTPPYKADRDKKTWKGKVVKQLKKMGGQAGSAGPVYPEGGSIGVPLDECPLVDHDCVVPFLVKLCCDIVTDRGLDIVGIYRVPGNNAAVTYLTEQVNKGVDSFALEDHRWQDVNVVSSLLKSFFRKLPDPLFTVELYSMFIEASKVEVPNRRLDQLRRLVRELPEIHLETLKYLTAHLCQVADHSEQNKMEIRNLAIVFGPTLVRTTDDNMVSMVTDMSQQCRIIESLLANWEFFFSEDMMDLEPALLKDAESEPSLSVLGSGTSNQSLMLANLQKLEEAGKVGGKTDVSAKDIVTSIISAANRKMLRAATKGKKDIHSDFDSEGGGRTASREGLDSRSERRESEAVIHGALQIASAVPGLMGSISAGSVVDSERGTPDSLETCHRLSRQGSLCGGSRRGSLPCTSQRGSICEYSGGAVCEVTPVGEQCETRVAMMKSDKETVTNGLGENQEVVTGTLSLVNVPGYPRVASSQEDMGQVRPDTVGGAMVRPISAPPVSQGQPSCLPVSAFPGVSVPKFPIETYAGLEAATAQRIAKFEAETKAMLTQRSSLAKSSTDLREQQHGSTTSCRDSSPTQSSSLMISQNPLPSLTTPAPASLDNPLEGGILVEDPYPTDVYNNPPAPLPSERLLLRLAYRTSLPNLAPREQEPGLDSLPPGTFNTQKVAARGTLQRMKPRPSSYRPELSCLGSDFPSSTVSGSPGEESQSSEMLLNSLSASFDQKMRLLLDPDFQNSSLSQPSLLSPIGYTRKTVNYQWNKDSDLSSAQEESSKESKGGLETLKKSKEGSPRRVELRRVARVERHPGDRQRRPRQPFCTSVTSSSCTAVTSASQAVLMSVNQEKSVSLPEPNLAKVKESKVQCIEEAEKENKKSVSSLRDHFEQRANTKGQVVSVVSRATNIDVNRLRKKLSEVNKRRIKRRHTVGGTKDFSANLVNLLVRGVWDRLAPLNRDKEGLVETEVRRFSLQGEEGWRHSFPHPEIL